MYHHINWILSDRVEHGRVSSVGKFITYALCTLILVGIEQ